MRVRMKLRVRMKGRTGLLVVGRVRDVGICVDAGAGKGLLHLMRHTATSPLDRLRYCWGITDFTGADYVRPEFKGEKRWDFVRQRLACESRLRPHTSLLSAS